MDYNNGFSISSFFEAALFWEVVNGLLLSFQNLNFSKATGIIDFIFDVSFIKVKDRLELIYKSSINRFFWKLQQFLFYKRWNPIIDYKKENYKIKIESYVAAFCKEKEYE